MKDFAELRGAIRAKYGTQEAFACDMGMSVAALSSRLTGKVEWSRSEMEHAAQLLRFPIEKVYFYFFA